MAEENQNNSKNTRKQDSGNGKKSKLPFNYLWIYVALALGILAVSLLDQMPSNTKDTDWETFKTTMLAEGDVKKVVVINEKFAKVYIKEEKLTDEKYKEVAKNAIGGGTNPGPHYRFNIGPPEGFARKWEEAKNTLPEAAQVGLSYETEQDWGDLFQFILPFLIILGLFIFIMRRMGGAAGGGAQIFNIGKSKAQLFDKDTQVSVTFEDVAGLEEAKVEIKEIVDFLKNPKKYTALGAKIPKGALLVGPPGTGKTLLAKAVAGEAKVPFFSLSGSDFVEMFVGVGASRVRDLFRQAKEKAPAIIFIDEIDAIGRARGRGPAQGANDERENTLNQLLTEMDGFGTNSGVIILAATNRADVLDRALMRAGRFDRQIFVDMPDLVERKQIFNVHLKSLRIDDSVDIEFLAKQTPGFSGADIANVCNEAALIAARKDKTSIGKNDFLDAVDRIIGGLEKKSKIISPEEKKVIAYHEAGHASVSWLVEHASPLVKVTIVPRGRSLGAAWYLPEERQITTTEQLLDEMCAALGGRAAEEVIFGKVSTGALSDLERVTKQAYAMVSVYGLNDKVGNISYYDSSGSNDYAFQKPYSEETAKTIDEEVKKIVEAQYERAKKILMENKDLLSKLATRLLEEEVIFKEDLEVIFGKRPFEKPRDGESNETSQDENKLFTNGNTPAGENGSSTDGKTAEDNSNSISA